jgi:maltose alpha-D-glucosyltransferase / alpha-amylase
MLDLWYKNAVIYCLDVDTFIDSNGDGIGDFKGLEHRLDHLSGLGINCVWLMPFYPSPNRDEGYDVLDYYGIDRNLGNPGDFVNFTRQCRERGIRVLIDLVVNHTSTDHPWFQAARADPNSKYRGYYLWADEPPEDAKDGIVFPGQQESTWTYDEEAGAYYHHRFYHHQPDLNIANPEVHEEIENVMGYWLELGVSGFRLDAAPFLIEMSDPHDREAHQAYRFLRHLRHFLQWRRGDAIILAEANVPADEVTEYFGDGDRMHMLSAFLINQYTFLALARENADPLRQVFERLPPLPEAAQWATFLRGHDELDLGRLDEDEREEVFRAFAPEEHMQLYHRGIRRRLAPMLGNDRRRIELAYALMFSLPGTPVLFYGEEIGMGEDLSLPERNAVRTPMQWSAEENGGFSTAPAEKLIRPVIESGEFGYEQLNVTAPSRDPASLLNRMERIIRPRRGTPEFGWGAFRTLEVDRPCVFAHLSEWRDNRVLALHNLSREPCEVRVDLGPTRPRELMDILEDCDYPSLEAEHERIPLEGYGYRWVRLEGTRR